MNKSGHWSSSSGSKFFIGLIDSNQSQSTDFNSLNWLCLCWVPHLITIFIFLNFGYVILNSPVGKLVPSNNWNYNDYVFNDFLKSDISFVCISSGIYSVSLLKYGLSVTSPLILINKLPFHSVASFGCSIILFNILAFVEISKAFVLSFDAP